MNRNRHPRYYRRPCRRLPFTRTPTRHAAEADPPGLAHASPQRVVAALYEHPGGTELRVFFEAEERDDLLQSEVHRDAHVLELKAQTLGDILRGKG